jgi:flagellar motor switch protein FliM
MRTTEDLFSFSVWSEYSVVENWLGGQPRNTPNIRNEDQGMRTGEDLFSFSVWSEYSVVENLLGGQPRNTLNTRK